MPFEKPADILKKLSNTQPSQRSAVFSNYSKKTIYGYLRIRKLPDDVIERLELEEAPVAIYHWVSYGKDQAARQVRFAIALFTRKRSGPDATVHTKNGWAWLSSVKLAIAEQIFYEKRTASVTEGKFLTVESLDIDDLRFEIERRLKLKPLRERRKRNTDAQERQDRIRIPSKDLIKTISDLVRLHGLELVKNPALQEILNERKDKKKT